MAIHGAAELGTTYDCKVAGCTGSTRVAMGPYAYLCDEHAEAAKKRRRPQGYGDTASVARRLPVNPTLADKVKTLDRAARSADKSRSAARKLTEQALAAKAKADEAELEFRQLVRDLIGPELVDSDSNGSA
jgi:hypothetical protein